MPVAVIRDADAAAVMSAHRAGGARRFHTGPGYSRDSLARVVAWFMQAPDLEWTVREVADVTGVDRSAVGWICVDLHAVGHLSRRVGGTGPLMIYRMTGSGIATYRPTSDRADGTLS